MSKSKIIFRHPLGRFVVRERTIESRFGGVVQIRETFLTPNEDLRGIAPQKIAVKRPDRTSGYSHLDKGDYNRVRELRRAGKSIEQIALILGRAKSTIQKACVKIRENDKNDW